MVAPIVAAGGAKAAERAGKALTGDIYTRRWTSVTGKGKKKKAVEHELRVNPVGLGLGAAAVGLAALFGGVALWATQRKLGVSEGADMIRILDLHAATYKTVTTTVVVADGYYATTYIKGVPKEIWVPPVTSTVTTTVLDTAAHWTLSNTYGMPVARGTGIPDKNAIITRREQSLGYVFVEDIKTAVISPTHGRTWLKYHSDKDRKLTTGPRPGMFTTEASDMPDYFPLYPG